MAVNSFRDVKAWQAAYQLIIEIYRLTANFLKSEIYGLTAQVRRAAVSVALNIAEGFKRISSTEACRFYSIAQASLEEVRCGVFIAKDLTYCTEEKFLHVE